MDTTLLEELWSKNTTQMNETQLLILYNSLRIFDIYLGKESITLISLYVPVFLMGFFGNMLVTLLVLTNQQLRNSTNFYLCNMAMADFLVSLICVPMAVGHTLYKVWIYGEFMCKLTAYLQGVTVAASVFTIATLSIDRYLAIRHPMVFRRVSNTKVATRIIVVIWIVSMSIMVPLLVVKKVDTLQLFEEPLHFCHELWPNIVYRQVYDVCLFVIVYMIPGIIIFCAYILIGNKLWTEDKHLQRRESATSTGIGKQVMLGRKRVAKMLIALALLFAICWLPYYIVSLYLDFTTENTNSFLFFLPFTILLGHSNSAFNPILYFYSSKSFRKYLYRAFKCKSKQTKRSLAFRYTPAKSDKKDVNIRPRIRISSTGSFRSTGTGSFRFSRSSNVSLKSSGKSRDNSLKGEKGFKRENDNDKQENIHSVDKKGHSLPLVSMYEDNGKRNIKTQRKREILDTSLSIPTTINEESSRLGSISLAIPWVKPDVMPDINETSGEIQTMAKTSQSPHSMDEDETDR